MNIKKIIQIVNAIRAEKYEEKGAQTDLVVVLTGATGMIGREIAMELYKSGAKLVLYSRQKSKLKKEFGGLDSKSVLLCKGEVANSTDVKSLFSDAINTFGRVDVLINCVGAFADRPIDQISTGEVEDMFDANVRSVFLTCREAVVQMKKQKSGIIINIGSRISRNSNISENKAIYASSKYALEGFSVALSKSVSKYNIRVVCLLPATASTFPTKKFFQYLVPSRIAKIIIFILSMPDIDFDPIAFKSVKHNI